MNPDQITRHSFHWNVKVFKADGRIAIGWFHISSYLLKHINDVEPLLSRLFCKEQLIEILPL